MRELETLINKMTTSIISLAGDNLIRLSPLFYIFRNYTYLSDKYQALCDGFRGQRSLLLGSLIYTKHGSALTMESCAFTGGRFVATATGVEARYFVTDHLPFDNRNGVI